MGYKENYNKANFKYKPLSKLNYFRLSIESKIAVGFDKEISILKEIGELNKQIENLKYNRKLFLDLKKTIEQILDEDVPNLALDFENPFDLKMKFLYKKESEETQSEDKKETTQSEDKKETHFDDILDDVVFNIEETRKREEE